MLENEHNTSQTNSGAGQSKTPTLLKQALKISLFVNLPLLLLPNIGLMLPTWSWIELWSRSEVVTDQLCYMSTYEWMIGFPVSFVGIHGNDSCTAVFVFNIVGLVLTALFFVVLAYTTKWKLVASRHWLKVLFLISVVVVVAIAIRVLVAALMPFSYSSFY